MRRRMAVVLLVGLGLFLGDAAGAQTTTTSSTTSSSTTTTGVVPTIAPATTSTTLVNPCIGQPCTEEAPTATLSGSDGNARLITTESCWRQPVFAADGAAGGGPPGPVTKCFVATLAPDIPVGLVVRNGERLTLRFDIGMSPTEVVLRRGDQTTALTPANPTSFTADLPVGIYLVSFQTRWNQGNAAYVLKVDVRAAAGPATPQTGGIALTG